MEWIFKQDRADAVFPYCIVASMTTSIREDAKAIELLKTQFTVGADPMRAECYIRFRNGYFNASFRTEADQIVAGLLLCGN